MQFGRAGSLASLGRVLLYRSCARTSMSTPHAAHAATRAEGRDRPWYEAFTVHIAKVERAYEFIPSPTTRNLSFRTDPHSYACSTRSNVFQSATTAESRSLGQQ